MMKKTLSWQKKFAFVVTQSWDVWKNNSFAGFVRTVRVCFHWKQQIFTFRSIFYSSDKR